MWRGRERQCRVSVVSIPVSSFSSPAHTPTHEGRRYVPAEAEFVDSTISLPARTPTHDGREYVPAEEEFVYSTFSSPAHTPTHDGRRYVPAEEGCDDSTFSSPAHTPTNDGRRYVPAEEESSLVVSIQTFSSPAHIPPRTMGEGMCLQKRTLLQPMPQLAMEGVCAKRRGVPKVVRKYGNSEKCEVTPLWKFRSHWFSGTSCSLHFAPPPWRVLLIL